MIMSRCMKKIMKYIVIYCVIVFAFYFIAAEDWTKEEKEIPPFTASDPIRVEAGHELIQTFSSEMDRIDAISIFPAAETDTARVKLTIERNGEILWSKTVSAQDITNYVDNSFAVDPIISGAKNERHTLHITGEDGVMVLYAGNRMSAGKFEVNVASNEELRLDGTLLDGCSLVLGIHGFNEITAYRYIIPVSTAIGFFLIIAIFYLHTEKGRSGKFNKTLNAFRQYGLLLRQLVMRDFKVKYKSSALGMIWSFLNPLLTMLVYFFVFSTIFQNNIENFPAYLITGIIVFNYFSEATSLGMTSIVGNGGLITKVYIPKYIFPLSKILSSAINLCISTIPMLVIILLSGIPLQKSMLLLPVAMLFLMMFSLGIGLILATMNTFFRDTQFLWSVLITLWSFLTPIFYPASIIPPQFFSIYQMNPMYHMVGFVRSIMVSGTSPSPMSFVYCVAVSLLSLVLGLYVFRKKQNEFVLHL